MKVLICPDPTTPFKASSQSETSSLAVISFVATFFIPIVGWVLGVKARREIDASDGRKSGRGLATASIWLGVIGTIGITIIVAILVIGSSSNSGDSSFSAGNGTYNGSCEPTLLQLGLYDKGTRCNP
jgi:hypothetical protein